MTLVELDKIHPHEEIFPGLEEAVYRQLTADGFFAWPVVADATVGMIFDGSHRYGAVANRLKGRRILVQKASYRDQTIKLFNWCRLFFNIEPSRFLKIKEKHGLREIGSFPYPGTKLVYGGQAYSFGDSQEAFGQYWQSHRLELELGIDPREPYKVFKRLEEAEPFVGQAGALVIIPPVLSREALISLSAQNRLPPKSTRFVLPYRVLGPRVPLWMLTEDGEVSRFNQELEKLKEQRIRYLGQGLSIERVYPEELYSYEDYVIPRHFFAQEEGYRAYLCRLEDKSSFIS